jgi:CelD/BcsL family acetyltransferase involved in cellulose biosynthesis
VLVIEEIRDVARFRALKEEWNELLADSAANCIFLTWEWLYTWWCHLAEDRKLHLMLVRNEGRLIALAPLSRRSGRWKRLMPFPALEFLGVGSVGSDYLDIIIRRGEERRAIAALADCLGENKLMVDFSQVAASAHAVELTQELKRRGWTMHRRPTDLCPYINLAGQTWESYLGILSPAHRYNLRRRLRNLDKRGSVSFERALSEEQCAEGIKSVVALHELRWKDRGQPGVFRDPRVVDFHRELSLLALQRGWLRLYTLRLDGKTVAAWYGFNYHGVISFYQTGFDPAWYKYSVGLVMMGLAIKAALEEGAQVYDFLRGDESYKSLWSCQERELVRLELFPPSRRGAIYRQAMELRWNIKKISRAGAQAKQLTMNN